MEASPTICVCDQAAQSRAKTADSHGTGVEVALFSDLHWRELAECLRLTPRQLDIARGICSGRRYKSIAAGGGITVNTVRMHVRALYAKLDVHDSLSAILRIVHLDRQLHSSPGNAPQRTRGAAHRLLGM